MQTSSEYSTSRISFYSECTSEPKQKKVNLKSDIYYHKSKISSPAQTRTGDPYIISVVL